MSEPSEPNYSDREIGPEADRRIPNALIKEFHDLFDELMLARHPDALPQGEIWREADTETVMRTMAARMSLPGGKQVDTEAAVWVFGEGGETASISNRTFEVAYRNSPDKQHTSTMLVIVRPLAENEYAMGNPTHIQLAYTFYRKPQGWSLVEQHGWSYVTADRTFGRLYGKEFSFAPPIEKDVDAFLERAHLPVERIEHVEPGGESIATDAMNATEAELRAARDFLQRLVSAETS